MIQRYFRTKAYQNNNDSSCAKIKFLECLPMIWQKLHLHGQQLIFCLNQYFIPCEVLIKLETGQLNTYMGMTKNGETSYRKFLEGAKIFYGQFFELQRLFLSFMGLNPSIFVSFPYYIRLPVYQLIVHTQLHYVPILLISFKKII